MEHRLKFRVWDDVKKMWVDNTLFTCFLSNEGKLGVYFDGLADSPEHMNQEQWLKIEDNRFIIQQCTGLRDKNGKLIYVGDYVSYLTDYNTEECGQVVDLNYKIMVEALTGDDEGNDGIELHPDALKDIEIIGNTLENPELLKGE